MTRLRRTRERMCAAVLDCLVDGYVALEPAIMLPDPDNRHVAAANRAGAGIIVTFNLRDFPDDELSRHGVVALHPDAFVSELLARNPAVVLEVIAGQATDLKKPPLTALDVLAALERCGPSRFGASYAQQRGDDTGGPLQRAVSKRPCPQDRSNV